MPQTLTRPENGSGPMLLPSSTKMPSPRFWDRIARRYAKSPIADQAAYDRKLELTREHFEPDARVLEFGCGTGSTAIAHAPYVGHILATDVSSKMLEIAREKADAAGVANVQFEQTSIEALAVGEASFDVVMGMSILHLLEDRSAAMTKAWQLLKPGGVFISSTACLADSHGFLRPILPVGRLLGLLPYVEFFGRGELEADIEQAGFDIELTWQPAKGKAVFVVARKGAG